MAITVPFSGLDFPEDVHSLGATCQIKFNAVVQQTDDGSEQRIGTAKHPLRTWSVSFDARDKAQVETIKTFYEARNGSHEGFWWFDWFDYDATTTPKTYVTSNQQYNRRIDSSIVANEFRVAAVFQENSLNVSHEDSLLLSVSFTVQEIRYATAEVTGGIYGVTSTATLPQDKLIYNTISASWSKVTKNVLIQAKTR